MTDSPEKSADYLRIIRLIVDVGTELARKVLYYFLPKSDVKKFFKSRTNRDDIKALKQKHVLSKFQFDTLENDPDPDKFDISLIVILITNLFQYQIDTPGNRIGDDLAHLKDIRNKLVGHRPKAHISRDEYNSLWQETEDVFLSLSTFLGERVKIQKQLFEYKTAKLEEDNGLKDKYLGVMQNWFDETKARFKDWMLRMDPYLEDEEGFEIFFKTVPEGYWQHIILLYEGGMTVMTALLDKLVKDKTTDLENVLRLNMEQLSEIPLQKAKLYNGDLINTSIGTWQLTTLVNVIQIAFALDLDEYDHKALAEIKLAAENFAETAKDFLNNDSKHIHLKKISTSINNLAASVDKKTQRACSQLIEKHDDNTVNEAIARSYILKLRHDCRPFRSISQMYREAQAELEEIIGHMTLEGISFLSDQVVELKMMTFGKKEEKKELAEEILYQVWNEAVKMTGNSGKFDDVKMAVKEIIEIIRGIKGVTISSVERHCIIVTIVCQTYQSVFELLIHLDDEYHWENLSSQLSALCQDEIVVTGFISVESLQLIAKRPKAEKKEDSNAVTVRLACSSEEVANNLFGVLGSHNTSETLHRVSNALSKCVSNDISIETELNKKVLDEVPRKCVALKEIFKACESENTDNFPQTVEDDDWENLRELLVDLPLAARTIVSDVSGAMFLQGISQTTDDIPERRISHSFTRSSSTSSLYSLSSRDRFARSSSDSSYGRIGSDSSYGRIGSDSSYGRFGGSRASSAGSNQSVRSFGY